MLFPSSKLTQVHLLYQISFNSFFFFGGRIIGKFHGSTGSPFVWTRRLVVRRIREFNVAVLGKWCWRQVMDREGLW